MFDACMGIEKPDQNKMLARDAFLLALYWDSFHSDTTATRRLRRCVRCLILFVPPILVYAQVSNPATESGGGRVEARRTDVWLVGPTRRLPKPAHVLNKNPDSVVGSDI